LFNQNAPNSLAWNSPYSVSCWAYNPDISDNETLIAWARRGGPNSTYAALYYGSNATYGATGHWAYTDMAYAGGPPVAGSWHHIAVTFDGLIEKLYVDNKLNRQMQKNLYVNANSPIYIGWSTDAAEYLTGSIASLKMYDYPLTTQDVATLYAGNDVVTSLSEEESLPPHLNVYPNPSTDQLIIACDAPWEKAELINGNGQVVFQTSNIGKESIDVSQIARGIYLLKVKVDGNNYTKKIMLQQ
jgi:hypothetical protein